MKILKMFGNTAGFVLLAAIALIIFPSRFKPLAVLDATLFDLGARLTTQRNVPDDITLVTLPVTGAEDLADTPALTSELIRFLENLKGAKPTAAVFMLEGYPRTVVNSGLLQVEDELAALRPSLDTDHQADVAHILTLTEALSGPGALLARALQGSNVLVAAKITGDQGLSPQTTMASTPPGEQSLLERLPPAAGEADMAAVSPVTVGENTAAPGIVPLFPGDTKSREWPLVWRYGDGFLPDLVTLLYQKEMKSADPVWVERTGVRFDYYLMKTDTAGRLRPLLLTSDLPALEIETLPLGEISTDKDLEALKNKIVLIGSADDPALQSSALAYLSMAAEATAHTPVWGLWLEKGLLLLFALYLICLLQRLQMGAGIVLSVLLLCLSLVLQWGGLVIKGIWLPLTTAMAYLIAGHILVQFRIHSKGHLLKLEMKKHDAFFELGSHYSENRRFDQAFEALKECVPTRQVLDSLFDIGLAYERRQKLKKAGRVFEYIHSRHKDFRGAGKRAGQLMDFLEGRVGEGVDGTKTVTMPSLELQRTVLGRYEIERELGRGAMGVVYLGRDPKIGRRVAIKTLDLADAETQCDDHDAAKKRFFREAEAIGRLTHPNIVTVYDVGEEDDLAFIAMDFLTGTSLGAYTDKHNLLPVPTVYNITIQVAEALAYAHSQNVIHRDIKPGNIIYNEKEGQVKVTDFGIARLVDATVTSTHTILGSPSFMAPEQLKGAKVDGRADIFSLGITFFQLLTGQFPFQGKDLATITYQITNEETPNITQFRTGLPRSARNIIYKALGKDPDERYQSAGEMAAALRRGAPKSAAAAGKK